MNNTITEKHKPKRIPNELSNRIGELKGRQKMIRKYGNMNTTFGGVNAEGEDVLISFDTESGIKLSTFQKNGWLRVNYFDKDGVAEGETFEGKWTDTTIKRENVSATT